MLGLVKDSTNLRATANISKTDQPKPWNFFIGRAQHGNVESAVKRLAIAEAVDRDTGEVGNLQRSLAHA
jgi:hypothetical protein